MTTDDIRIMLESHTGPIDVRAIGWPAAERLELWAWDGRMLTAAGLELPLPTIMEAAPADTRPSYGRGEVHERARLFAPAPAAMAGQLAL